MPVILGTQCRVGASESAGSVLRPWADIECIRQAMVLACFYRSQSNLPSKDNATVMTWRKCGVNMRGFTRMLWSPPLTLKFHSIASYVERALAVRPHLSIVP